MDRDIGHHHNDLDVGHGRAYPAYGFADKLVKRRETGVGREPVVEECRCIRLVRRYHPEGVVFPVLEA